METVVRPLVVMYGYVNQEGSLVFLGRKGQIEITGHVAEIQAILKYCNGFATIAEIREKVSEVDEQVFHEHIDLCLHEGILVNSAELFKQFHADSENPPLFGHELSAVEVRTLSKKERSLSTGVVVGVAEPSRSVSRLYEIAISRKSTRAFSQQAVEVDLLLSLLATLYSSEDFRTTPSAGGLYPMRIFIATSDSGQKLSPMLHEYNPATRELICSGRTISGEDLSRCLDTSSEINGLVIFVVCDLSRVTAKYSNRGYRLALIEAGHIAQNAYLFAAEQHLAVLELSSFEDQVTAEFLGINYPEEVTLTSLVVGYEEPQGKPQFTSYETYLLHDLKKVLVGDETNKPIELVELVNFGTPPYEMKKHVAVAVQKPILQHTETKEIDSLFRQSTGISTNSATAQLKAIVEAYERHSSGKVRVDFSGSAVDLLSSGHEVVDPRVFAPYADVQFERALAHLEQFNPEACYEWVKGRRWSTGNVVYVPIELVFFPIKQVGRKLCYEGNSSGVAAHTSYEQALSGALFELIERDAIAVTWYTHRQVSAIRPEVLGNNFFLRTERWRTLGWESKVLDMTLDSAQVSAVLLHSKEHYPHLVMGSAASHSFQPAASKALDEAEVMLTSWRQMRRPDIKAEEVKSVLDHGLLYYQGGNTHHLDWLLNAPAASSPSLAMTLEQSWSRFDPIVIDLITASDRIPLFVVRVLSDRLMPINFGFGTEHVDHPRVKMLGLNWVQDYPAQPHMLA